MGDVSLAAALNTVLLAILVPAVGYGVRALRKNTDALSRLETVLVGFKTDTGLVGKVENHDRRIGKLEAATPRRRHSDGSDDS